MTTARLSIDGVDLTPRTFTIQPTDVWVTPLGADGEPCGPRQRIGAGDWVSIEVTEAGTRRLHITKEHRTMTTAPPPRTTKAELWEQLTDARAELEAALSENTKLDRMLARTDPEARALADCTKALESMLSEQRAASERQRGSHTVYAQVGHVDPDRPTALDSPVGRILLHLAARYGVDIVAPHPPVPDEPNLADDGQTLLVVPEKLANSIQRLLAELPGYELDRLR